MLNAVWEKIINDVVVALEYSVNVIIFVVVFTKYCIDLSFFKLPHADF